jgi:hypothetical protein
MESLFFSWFCYNKTELPFCWKMGYECISTKLNLCFVGILTPVGTDEWPNSNKTQFCFYFSWPVRTGLRAVGFSKQNWGASFDHRVLSSIREDLNNMRWICRKTCTFSTAWLYIFADGVTMHIIKICMPVNVLTMDAYFQYCILISCGIYDYEYPKWSFR